MADFRGSHVHVDPFGEMLRGYRDSQKDSYDSVLKRTQIASHLQKMSLARQAGARASDLHAEHQKFQALYGNELDRLRTEATVGEARLRGKTLSDQLQHFEADTAARRADEARQRGINGRMQDRDERLLDQEGRPQPALVPNRGLNYSPRPGALPSVPGITISPGGAAPPAGLRTHPAPSAAQNHSDASDTLASPAKLASNEPDDDDDDSNPFDDTSAAPTKLASNGEPDADDDFGNVG